MEELLGMLFFAAILGLIPGFIAKSKLNETLREE